MKRIVSVLLALIMVLTAAGCSKKVEAPVASAQPTEAPTAKPVIKNMAEGFSGGMGTEDDPYQIATVEELNYFAYVTSQEYDDKDSGEADRYQRASYVLTEDIAVNDTADFDTWKDKAPENLWLPV